MSSYANIPNIKEQTGWRVPFWFAVSSPLVDVLAIHRQGAKGVIQFIGRDSRARPNQNSLKSRR